jgi:hypothetical protein
VEFEIDKKLGIKSKEDVAEMVILSALFCPLSAVRCLLSAVCCLLSAVCCLLSAACYLPSAGHQEQGRRGRDGKTTVTRLYTIVTPL